MQDEPNLFTLESSAPIQYCLKGDSPLRRQLEIRRYLFNRYGQTDYLEAFETSTGNSVDIETSAAKKVAAKKEGTELLVATEVVGRHVLLLKPRNRGPCVPQCSISTA